MTNALPPVLGSLSFGFYPRPLAVTAGPVSIEILPDLDKAVADVVGDEGVERDWIYPPLQEVRHLGGGISTRPYPSRIFGLPKTHRIAHSAPDSTDHLIFHIWVLSFFTGMRLTSTDAGFLDATPIKPGKLVDFVLLRGGVPKAVELAEAFWVKHRADPRRAHIVAAAIHALFLGQNPVALQYERFLSLYTAFDACFALAQGMHKPRGRITHSGRVAWMCGLFGMPIPAWADPNIPSGPEIASLRNETVHEALFMGEPLGFAIHGVGSSGNLTLEMEALLCRLIVALLGASASTYVRTPGNTRQRQGLDLG